MRGRRILGIGGFRGGGWGDEAVGLEGGENLHGKIGVAFVDVLNDQGEAFDEGLRGALGDGIEVVGLEAGEVGGEGGGGFPAMDGLAGDVEFFGDGGDGLAGEEEGEGVGLARGEVGEIWIRRIRKRS